MKLRTLFVCAAIALAQSALAKERSLLVRPIVDATKPAVGKSKTAATAQGERLAEAKPQVMTAEEKSALLQEKLRTVAQLQHEIQKLRAEVGIHQQIRVRVEMLEVSLSKLRKMKTEIASIYGSEVRIDDFDSLQRLIGPANSESEDPSRAQIDQANAIKMIDWMKKNSVAKVVCKPTIVTESGRPASIFIGDESVVPAPAESGTTTDIERCGTELDVLATALAEQKVRLEIRLKVSKRCAQELSVLGSARIPAKEVHSCDTCISTKVGRPVVLAGSVSERVETVKTSTGKVWDEVDEMALVVVVTPDTDGPIATADNDSTSTVR